MQSDKSLSISLVQNVFLKNNKRLNGYIHYKLNNILKMLRNKNTFDISVFSGDLFQDSIDINSLFMSESNHFPMEVIHKFFQKSFKLRNVSKQGYWERKRTRSSVRYKYSYKT